MGAAQSSIDPRYVRIWGNLSSIGSVKTRIEMLETLLVGPEYVEVAKKLGMYVQILQWISKSRRGEYSVWPTPIVEAMPTPSTTLARIPPPKRALDVLNESYAILGIDDTKPLTHEVLKTAYKRAAMVAHPDKGGSSEAFDAVTRAFLYIQDILTKLLPTTGKDGSDPRFTQPVTKESALSARGIKKVDPAPPEANRLEDQPPIALNPKKLDMNVFNKLFEENRLPDPDKDDGYGDWLKANAPNTAKGLSESSQQTMRSKFNKDVFHKTFESDIQKRTESSTLSQYRPPSEIMLNPDFGAELGSSRPEQYTKPPVSGGIGYTDLKHAYGDGSTFSQDIQDVSLDGRPKTLEQAKREYGTAPRALNANESAAVQAFERARELAEEQRRRRLAAHDVDSEAVHSRLQRRLQIQN